MNISKIYKFQNIKFTGVQKGSGTTNVQDNKDKMDYFVNKTREVLAERAEMEVPENGKFSSVSASFKIPDTQNKARIIISHDELEPKNLRRLSVGVHHINSDRLTSNYILKGTKKEILDYLKDQKSQDELIGIIGHLSESVDKYYSEQ